MPDGIQEYMEDYVPRFVPRNGPFMSSSTSTIWKRNASNLKTITDRALPGWKKSIEDKYANRR